MTRSQVRRVRTIVLHDVDIHIVKFDIQDQVLLGRSIDADITIPDNSVSKEHAFLSTDGYNIFVKDLDSKFGTCVLL